MPSLVQPDGSFYPDVEDLEKHAKLDEIDRELRAQVERTKAMGLEPSHLDSHMHALFSNPDLFAVLQKVARDYKLPIRMARNEKTFHLLVPYMTDGDPFPDAIFSPSENVTTGGWMDYYMGVVKNLCPGLTELFVHLAHDDAETQAVTVDHPNWGAAWCQRDLDVISSPEFKKTLEDNHIILIGWNDLKKLLE